VFVKSATGMECSMIFGMNILLGYMTSFRNAPSKLKGKVLKSHSLLTRFDYH